MEIIDLVYIIPLLLSLLLFSTYLFKTKEQTNPRAIKNKWVRYFPIYTVLFMSVGVMIISKYYEDKINRLETEELMLQSEINKSKIYNSIISDKLKRLEVLDSLINKNKDYKNLIEEIKKQEVIVGDKTDILKNIEQAIEDTENNIDYINSYNEIIDTPKEISKGYTYSGETNKIIFVCPVEKNSEYLNFGLKFKDEKIINDIACIYVTINERVDNNNYTHLYSQAFAPKTGINNFKIKNYLFKENTIMRVGYFLKSDFKKDEEYPYFHSVSCK
ncbi:MAG: hypothetical protein BM557_02125 [Flavobacterium sp. MedPE-SWcel]|uniref:hypothetical protein n=1 Tax=uncultured Flavobacterium sp. TaxID=165435 RepID=UPI0009184792|nr:hypothetical protein [uncultured Flavobacterium sp.]OIQ22195.1 MAG: hypothetical protein BM557_02125 [Flavobacterium sp. MedPE-SWcel]